LLTADEYDEEKILIRFAKIFEQAYTRFLDLQKAEVQAREAQIEAALEKVRSRSLAMYKSEEIKNVIQLVFEQLIQLNIPVHQAGFLLDYKESDDWNYWSSDLLQSFPKFIKFKYFDHPLCKRYKEVKEKGLEFSTTVLSFEDKNSLVEESYKYIHDVPEDIKQTIYSYPGFAQSGFYLNHIALYAANFEAIPFSDEHNAVLKRFALVFEQSYTRFLDLQKAEAQAREAKIEAGLERVRSKTMAMHNSNDVGDTVVTMFDELVKLDIETLRCGVGIMQEGIKMELWTAKQDDNGKTGLVIGFMDMKIHPLLRGAYHGWESKKEDFSYVLQGDDVAVYFNAINNYPGYPVTYDLARVPATVFHHDFYFREGTLFVFTQKELTPENAQVLKRFSAVFGQTYRRYQDLKKAEAQAREAQIEASLEKVRSSAMSMHNSNDIAAATNVMFAELHKLEIQSIRCGVVLLSKSSHTGDLYAAATSSDGEFYTLRNTTRMTLHPSLIKQYESWLTQEMYVSVLTGEELRSYYQLPFFSSSVNYARPENYDRTEYGYYIPFSEGLFYAWTFHPYSEKEKNVLERFKNIIELTFRRFLDLQKAEAQAREAQIEAALERVRSRSIGMQKSDELKEVIQIVYEQFGHLNIHVEHTGFLIDYKTRDDMHIWLADKHLVPSEVTIPWFDSPPNNSIRDAKEKGKDFFSYQLTFEEKNKFYRELFKFVPGVPEETLEYFLTCPGLAGSGVLLENIGLYIENFSGTPYSVEGNAVLMRFGKVFQQTYTRFLDLQKAEAQAREARIEAALERVRSRTMAMQRSEELLEAGELLYKELTGLGIQSLAINYSFIDAKEENSYAYGINPVDGKLPPKPVLIPLTETDPMRLILSSWKKQQPVFRLELNEEDTLTHQTWIANILYEYFKSVELPFSREDFLTYHSPKNIVLYAFNFKEGYIFSAGGIKLTSSEEQLVSRFTKVFQQTYTRFLDLQKAEAQALEAIKRASVDRVRAEIASMRTTNDLERITPLIWNELTTLGVPFIRCGVFIMDEDQQQVQSFLSTPDGKAIAAFRLPYNSPGEIAQIVEHWHRKKMYKQHWNESQFIEFTQNLVQQGAVTSGEKYLTENRPTDLYLHFLPFLQGMLYAGNTAALSDDELQLVQNLADAFSTAYARYEDFNKLEAAKKQVDSTLNELQATQKQLIQSEKMASLGELTAGIAHEIQNPLNFVNNFSDVNKELLAELKEEIEKGNYEEVKVIAADIAGNEEKISHHGKRADSIVKGMLQHSRSTSPTKEPTDINALADEYLRLAYHGLRAKDKSFNATMNTSYDETMGKVGVIPQDIGRVILNVITNAFYTVNEKKNKLGDGYEPAVSMITKKMADGIEIRITDNGNGIPQKVVEKIFQPFFTTKPTGKGTGLGLSLAYDIVKAHNGEIKAETTEGVGTTFIIQLPVT
jgi:signal transduction histidine kinase